MSADNSIVGKTDGNEIKDIWVVYDGDCPFCSSYVRLYRIRERGHRLHLIDAREQHPLLTEVRTAGLDLDRGMVVKFAGRLYHAAAAMQLLAVLGAEKTLFDRLHRALFRHPLLAARLYPWLMRGRLLTLRMLGRSKIGTA